MQSGTRFILSILLIALMVGGYFFLKNPPQFLRQSRSVKVMQFFRHPEDHQEWVIPGGSVCNDAPFQFPTDGMIGYLWDDSFRPGHHHTGLDIFSGTEPGVTPIYAAYDGYLSRKADWISTVIIRIPADPLNPGRQIWTYYTHMADSNGNSYVDAAFPPGTHEVFVKAGTRLGTMGNYSGTAGNPTGVHLHFSIVKDDGHGNFLSELEIKNTLDPSPYMGMSLVGSQNSAEIPICSLSTP